MEINNLEILPIKEDDKLSFQSWISILIIRLKIIILSQSVLLFYEI